MKKVLISPIVVALGILLSWGIIWALFISNYEPRPKPVVIEQIDLLKLLKIEGAEEIIKRELPNINKRIEDIIKSEKNWDKFPPEKQIEILAKDPALRRIAQGITNRFLDLAVKKGKITRQTAEALKLTNLSDVLLWRLFEGKILGKTMPSLLF